MSAGGARRSAAGAPPSPRWWMPPLLAVQFLTRVPVPVLDTLDAATARAALSRSVLWFPVVGGLVGAVTGGTVLLAEQLWPRVVAVLLALIVEARLTGAFHEDAVADFCDGFGGGTTAERIREIMKDSRIGTYGALGLGLTVALRAALLSVLPSALILPAALAAGALGRWLAVALMAAIPPLAPSGDAAGGLARDVGTRPRPRWLLAASLLAVPFVLPLALASWGAVLGALAAIVVFAAWLRAALLRRLGGVSGDCLGFAVHAAQLAVLLAAAAGVV